MSILLLSALGTPSVGHETHDDDPDGNLLIHPIIAYKWRTDHEGERILKLIPSAIVALTHHLQCHPPPSVW